MKKYRTLAGLVILIVGIGIVALLQLLDNDVFQEVRAPDAITVKGYYGGEKRAFLHNEAVLDLLKQQYGITLDLTRRGSVAMVTTESLAGFDFVWPSNQVTVQLFEQTHPTVTFKSQIVFNSPLVIYTWGEIAEALEQRGVVEKRGEHYYIFRAKELMELVLQKTKWSEFGLNRWGSIALVTTDPRKSNSGNMGAGLIANLLQGEVVSLDTLPQVESQLVDYYKSLGLMEASSGTLFDKFIKSNGSVGMILGYENQMIEFSIEHQEALELIQQRVRVLYPEPTIMTSHPLISLNEKGQRLQQALEDPQIQEHAWRDHGFRTGISGIQNNPNDLKGLKVPEFITNAMPMPSARVMSRIIETLNQNL